MENAKKALGLNKKNQPKNASLVNVLVVELGSASELTLGSGGDRDESCRPYYAEVARFKKEFYSAQLILVHNIYF